MHDLINGGADFLTVQTNNATYGDTAQPDQQFAIERMRARELGRTLVVAATTGISGFIDASGGVQQSLEQDSVGYLVQHVTTSQSPPPGVRFGTVISATLCSVALIAIVVAAITRRRRRLPMVIA
jgi:apolipoprotein N-acyltransferase